ncbi:MAG TPA: hypothetical protein VHC69_31570 [Polyangiaceae bacterium]|nr:hypothetical protein [Polyangiaceae bacterium]
MGSKLSEDAAALAYFLSWVSRYASDGRWDGEKIARRIAEVRDIAEGVITDELIRGDLWDGLVELGKQNGDVTETEVTIIRDSFVILGLKEPGTEVTEEAIRAWRRKRGNAADGAPDKYEATARLFHKGGLPKVTADALKQAEKRRKKRRTK